ncbi:MAG: K(+)-transporting ATPase subunit F [Tahibacter sp.]
MSALSVCLLILSALLGVYLLVALLRPEKF